MAFSVGDKVRAIVENPGGHSRLPAYLRGREGRIVAFLGSFRFPGELAAGKKDGAPRELYTVRLEGSDVWGDDAPHAVSITADLFETYLRPL